MQRFEQKIPVLNINPNPNPISYPKIINVGRTVAIHADGYVYKLNSMKTAGNGCYWLSLRHIIFDKFVTVKFVLQCWILQNGFQMQIG